MKKKLNLTLLLLIVASFVFGQAKLIEKVEKKGNELIIPYEKYLLPNGLTLIIHEDHSDPVVHVDVTYHVGSAREEIGRSGFAHFFEHMMFQGSDHVKDDEHFKIVSEAGGSLNGTTNTDRTNYFETLPNNQLEIALWLEADRMGFLLDAVTQKKFEIQRSTVKNERGQNYDNRPYGRVSEKVAAALYAPGHPYSWPTIGYLEDLDMADVNDLKKFFLRWYGPNNATLTVAGDVKPAEVVKLAEKYFGSIRRGPEVKMPEKKPVTIDKDRYISYEDNIRFPLLQITYPTVPNRHPDEAPLDVFADILGGGKNSIFYKNFVKAQKAVNATAQHPAFELAGQMQLRVLPFPGKTLAEMETMIREALTEFEKRGVTDDDLTRYKATFESNTINSLASVSGKASQLAAYQTYTGNPNYLKQDLDRYLKVTKEDVMRVYNKYIKNKPAVILSVYPKGKPELVAKPDNFTPRTAEAKPMDLRTKNLQIILTGA
jgi:zinc protease